MTHRPTNISSRPRRQRGAIGIMMPFMMITILSIGAIAIDVGHLVVVRNELQNAADAAALAGAAKLYPATPAPQWTNAVSNGTSAIGLNKAAGVTLSTGAVQAGYWNLAGSPATLQAQTIVPTSNDAPAVQVTISRGAGSNGGPVAMLLAQVFGGSAASTSATAVAVVSAPGALLAGATPLPMVISSCLYSQFFNPTTGQPLTTSFKIGSSYHYGPCESGQWTTFFSNTNSDSATKNIINGNTPSPAMKIGDKVWVQTGTKTNLFGEVASELTGKTVIIPVVSDPTNTGFQTNGQMSIVAFAAFYIETAVGGSGKYVQGHFVGGAPVTNSGGGVGPYYGAYVPPRLAK
ncbi:MULTISPECIES: TadG family pilus assembly protein [unclassified Cupriavidus]|nr:MULTISPECIES: TadG family pilus assembly protein [unclassified Cupriavidus]MWL86437.1 hypothetical protein [Cupriavidus sp. SW-Y-13]